MNDIDAKIAAKKERVFEKAEVHANDVLHFFYDTDSDSCTNVNARKMIDSAQAVIERLNVWIAMNNGEVE